MPRYFIEVPHEKNTLECARAIEVFLRTGSHFLTHADWGCKDGEHKAWFTVEVDSREEARNIVPPGFRASAKVVELSAFTLDQIERIIARHST